MLARSTCDESPVIRSRQPVGLFAMSMTSDRLGGRIVLQTKTRLRDDEMLRDRDRLMYEALCDGKEVPDVARLFRHTPSYVYRRFKRMPQQVKTRIKRARECYRREQASLIRSENPSRGVAV